MFMKFKKHIIIYMKISWNKLQRLKCNLTKLCFYFNSHANVPHSHTLFKSRPLLFIHVSVVC